MNSEKPYIPRRISFKTSAKEKIQSESEFFANANKGAPLIILGEPGSGKTAMLKNFAKNTETSNNQSIRYLSASSFSGIKLKDTETTIIIDGLDELIVNNEKLSSILSRLTDDKNIIISCRTADWQNHINSRSISEKCSKEPIIGIIQPFNREEAIEFIRIRGLKDDPEEFHNETQLREVAYLLDNPQTLIMLLEVVANGEWPDNREKLFDKACHELAKEKNVFYNESTPKNTEDTLNTAGFVFAQLLLSGRAYIKKTGETDTTSIICPDLSNEHINQESISSVLSSRLFKPSDHAGNFEPCHRTIAEYLGARWIVDALKNTLPINRLENLIYTKKNVPFLALRGLHAWIATLWENQYIDIMISKDPYGFCRYGDPSVLTVSQSNKLFDYLYNLSIKHPNFRGDDWFIKIEKKLVKDDTPGNIQKVIDKISSPDTPTQFSHMIIESIQGTSFANKIANELEKIINNQKIECYVREAAIYTLSKCSNQPTWDVIASKLRSVEENSDSFFLLIIVMLLNPTMFSGSDISDAIISYEISERPYFSPLHRFLNNTLIKTLTTTQIEEALEAIQTSLNINSNTSGKFYQSSFIIQKWLFLLLIERFSRKELPLPTNTWSWLRLSTAIRDISSQCKFNAICSKLFQTSSEFKREIQSQALQSNNINDGLSQLHILKDAGLWLNEDDLKIHLNDLLNNRSKYADWSDRWGHLVLAGCRSRYDTFSTSFKKFIDDQAVANPDLSKVLCSIRQVSSNLQNNLENTTNVLKKRQEAQKQKRHNNYKSLLKRFKTSSDISDSDLSLINQASESFLGLNPNIPQIDNPKQRVIEWAGDDFAKGFTEILESIINTFQIPTMKELSEFYADTIMWQYHDKNLVVVLAYCLLTSESDQIRHNIPTYILETALACCYLNFCFGTYNMPCSLQQLQDSLEPIVFKERDSKQNFLNAIITPFLEKSHKAKDIPIICSFPYGKAFSVISKDLCKEWIEKYNYDFDLTKFFLVAIINNSDPDFAKPLIKEKISLESTPRLLWLSAAFLLDFFNYKELLDSQIQDSIKDISVLKDMINECNIELLPQQYYFIIKKFQRLWLPSERAHDSKDNIEDHIRKEISEFIGNQVKSLSSRITEEARSLLQELISLEGFTDHRGYMDHLSVIQEEKLLNSYIPPDLNDIRKVLLQGEPANSSDLQEIVLDVLVFLQNRIRNSAEKDYEIFWHHMKTTKDKDSTPHDENYCRNRIASAITPYLERYSISTDIEGAMPNDGRCDLLIRHKSMVLPVEIKGQWHPKIWSAAASQLRDYTNDYRADGRGIYLVLWFGELDNKSKKGPHGSSNPIINKPKTAEEMRTGLKACFSDLPPQTRIFVLDLSLPK